jgi:hypothetical protein
MTVTASGAVEDKAVARDRPAGTLLWAAVGAAVLIGVFLVLQIVSGVQASNVHTGDTDHLVKGARVASACLDRHVLKGCAHQPGGVWTDDFPYPLLQYIPAVALVRMGISNDHVVSLLARINLLSFLGSLACIVFVCRRARGLRSWTPELLIVMLASPVLFYALVGFGEMTAAFAALLFVCAVVTRRPVLTAVTLAVACLGKETMAPFLLLLGLACGRDPDDGWLPARRMLVPLVGGAVGGLALTAAFNLFRFGTPKNLFYLQDQFQTPGKRRVVDFFAQLWFAPAGGLLWFWLPAFALLLLLGWITVRHVLRDPRDWRGWLPTAAVAAVLVGFQFGLALWAYPFGWIAWGPRLTVPIVPAFAVAAVYTGGDRLRAMVDRALRPLALAVAIGAALVLAVLPQAGVVWSSGPGVGAILAPTPTCPGIQFLPQAYDRPDIYFPCVHQVAWRFSPWNLRKALPVKQAEGRVGQWALAAGVACLVAVARRRALVRIGRSDPIAE